MDERVYIRQTGLVPLGSLTEPVYIVGCGSIGSWTALALAKLGCQNITVADGDSVEIHNAGSQVFTSMDDGKVKVDALADKLPVLIEAPEVIEQVGRNITPQDIPENAKIIVMAVDSITTREQFFRYLKNSNRWLIDGRMAGNIVEVYAVKLDNEEDCTRYEQSFFPESEASPIACSMRSVVYNCFVISGMITNIISRIVQRKSVPKELIIDLENFTMFN